MAGECGVPLNSEQDMEESRQKNRCCSVVNRKLLPVKGFYFVFFAAVGSLLPFIAVYMKHLGLTSEETGIIYGVIPFLAFLVRPVVGAVADRWLRHRLVLVVCTVLTALLHCLILAVPSRATGPVTTLHVHPVIVRCQPEGSLLTTPACLFSSPGNEWNESLHSHESAPFPKAESPSCSVSLQEFYRVLSRAGMLSDDTSINDVQKYVNGTANPKSIETKTSRRLNNVFERNQENLSLSLSCHLYPGDTQDENSSSLFCFTNEEGQTNYTTRNCFKFPNNNNNSEPLTFNITIRNMDRNISSPERETLLGEGSVLYTKGCQDTEYEVSSVQWSGMTHTALTCPGSPSTLLCQARSADTALAGMMCAREEDGVHMDLTFGLMMLTSFLAAAAFAPVFSLIDAITFDQLGDQQHKYGQQRMWGTLGLAIMAITTTFTMSHHHDDVPDPDDVNYDIMFYLFTGLSLLAAVIAGTSLRVSSEVRCTRLVKNACGLLVLPEVLAFLVVVTYIGMVSGAIEGFLFWYLEDLGAEPLLLGLCLVVNCAFEIPFFYFSGGLLRRVGPVPCVIGTVGVLGVRLLVYSVLPGPWHVLPVEALHGLTFGLLWAAVAHQAHLLSPPGMEASLQGLVSGVYFGVGKGVGSVVTGVLFSAVGDRWTFRSLALTCVGIMILYCLLHTFAFSRPPPQPPQHPHTETLGTDSKGEKDSDQEQI